MDLTEKTLESREMFRGRLLRLEVDQVELPNGHRSVREVARHPGGVCVLPLFDDGTVSVVRQFRYPYKEIVTELPAGKLEPGEDPAEAVKRELAEETGCQAREWRSMGVFYPSPGFTDECLRLFFARGLTSGAAHPDDDEFIEGERVPFSHLVDQVMSGAIRDGKTMALVLKVKEFLDREKAR